VVVGVVVVAVVVVVVVVVVVEVVLVAATVVVVVAVAVDVADLVVVLAVADVVVALVRFEVGTSETVVVTAVSESDVESFSLSLTRTDSVSAEDTALELLDVLLSDSLKSMLKEVVKTKIVHNTHTTAKTFQKTLFLLSLKFL
jgi:hypothetical protein